MRKHFQSTYYLLCMCMYVQKFSYVILPPYHNLHIPLLIEKRIVQTKNTLSKSGNWLLYIPPTITLDSEFCPCNVFVFFM